MSGDPIDRVSDDLRAQAILADIERAERERHDAANVWNRTTEARRRAWAENRADYPRHEWGYVEADGWPSFLPIIRVPAWLRWVGRFLRRFR